MHGPFKVVPLNGVPSLQMPVIAAAGGEGAICGGEVIGAGAAVVCATAEKEKLVARATKKDIFFMPTPRTRTEIRAWVDSILIPHFSPRSSFNFFEVDGQGQDALEEHRDTQGCTLTGFLAYARLKSPLPAPWRSPGGAHSEPRD